MVSFRFHLVSLIAVFLALALGIGMGATVIDKATVDSLKSRVAAVEQQRDSGQQQVNELNRRLNRSTAWDNQARDYLVNNALKDVPVTVLAVRGVDEGVLGNQRELLQAAGANVQGTLYFTQKTTLTESSSVAQMQTLVGTTATDPALLRQALMARLAAVIAGSGPANSLKPFQQAGFVEWAGGVATDVSTADIANSRIIFMSAAAPAVPNDQLATPLTKLLAAQSVRRVTAIEAGRDPDGRTSTSGSRSVWLDVLRKDSSLDGRLSTVDDVETDLGRTATVLAARDLAAGRTGDYGVADTASAPLPKLPA